METTETGKVNRMKWRYLYSILPWIIQAVVTGFSRIRYHIFFQYTVRGRENIKDIKGAVIFASNHTSELDPVTVTTGIPFFSHFIPLFYVSLTKKFYKRFGWRKFFYGGTLFKACGAYPAIVGLNNYALSLSTHVEILNSNRSLCIFPEGKMGSGKTIHEAKGGVGYLAYTTKKPVVPMSVTWAFVDDFGKKLRKPKLDIVFGKPFYYDDLFKDILTPIITLERDDFRIAARKIMDVALGFNRT